MHATEQIANAVIATIRAAVPELAEVYKYGSPPSGRRLYPVATVLPGECTVDTQLSGNRRSGRVQTRRLNLGVAIRDVQTEDADYATRLTDLSAAVERCLAGWSVLPIDDIVVTGESGVQDVVVEGERGVKAGIALDFEITFYTVEGASDAILEPNL